MSGDAPDVRLVGPATDRLDAPWELARQTHDALVETLDPLDQTAAALATSGLADQDDFYEALDALLRDLEN